MPGHAKAGTGWQAGAGRRRSDCWRCRLAGKRRSGLGAGWCVRCCGWQRCRNRMTYWVRWAVKQGEAVEYSAWQQLDDGCLQQAMPTVHIPPGKLGSGSLEPVVVSLMLRRDASGTHALAVD